MSLALKEPEARPKKAAGTGNPGRTRPRPTGLWHRIVRDRALLLLMLPGVLFFLVFQYGALFGNVIAFKNYMPFLGLQASPWVGFENFETLFSEPAFWHAALNTVVLALVQLVFYFPVPLALALLLHSLTQGPVRKFVQSVVYLPHFISWVIVVALFQQLLGSSGALNGALGGDDGHLIDILGNPDLFKPLMVLELVWKESGWGTIIFLAALFQVDEGLYEASALDGAGPWRRFWHITLPALRPVIFLLLILRLGDILSVGFEQILLQRDAFGGDVAEVIDTYVYFHGIRDGNWGVAATAALFKGVIGAVLVFSTNKIAHRMGEQGVYR
ncbi:sugar ABC transporter permease [uncultured Streptomyces sp.]|uniref:ABC transporter permease n=1 Tax=uncultured Streptomyces sp. TaxID=174707 RepID=UPI002631264B|nr:ABC transporter permease subunit [uncultured Streptomyces sp.]